MKEREEIMWDDFLREEMRQTVAPAPSAEFMATVMQAVEAEAARQRMLMEPLISRRVWQRVGFGIGLVLLFPLLVGLTFSNLWSELTLTLAAFSLPENMNTVFSGTSSSAGYLPKLPVIAGSCFVILLLDKFCQRLISK